MPYIPESKLLRTNYIQPELPFKDKKHPTNKKIRYCVWCGSQLSGRARNWCSGGKCLLEYRAKCQNWVAVRKLLARNNRERNNNHIICESCNEIIYKPHEDGGLELVKPAFTKQGTKMYNAYEIDHKIAIALGGHPTDMSNLCLICVECHKKKTASDVAEVARQKQFIRDERVRLKKEQEWNRAFGGKSRWSKLTEIQTV
jgi:5-methylcytosine-specific restriction endonuclease McrA